MTSRKNAISYLLPSAWWKFTKTPSMTCDKIPKSCLPFYPTVSIYRDTECLNEKRNVIFQCFQTIIVSGTTIVSLVWRWIRQKWDVNRGPNIQLSGFHFIISFVKLHWDYKLRSDNRQDIGSLNTFRNACIYKLSLLILLLLLHHFCALIWTKSRLKLLLPLMIPTKRGCSQPAISVQTVLIAIQSYE